MFNKLLLLATNNLTTRAMSFYAVAIGREIGIYDNWSKCEEQIKGYRGARYKKFPTKSEAEAFIYEHNKFRIGKKFTFNPEVSNLLQHKTEPTTSNLEITDFWPPSDGDTFDDNHLTDDDLIMALAEVEGFAVPESSNSLKRKGDFDSSERASSKCPKHESKTCQPLGLKHVGQFEFQIDSEGYVICYTDGSCFNNGRPDACAGYGVYFGDNHPLNVGKPVDGRVTNNVGEIQASIYAIKTCKHLGIAKLCVCTDSQFLINSATIWIKGWKAKNWRLKNGDPVKNVVDFKELDDLLSDKKINVKWNYVAAHQGIKGNEMADRLAREGSEMHRRQQLNK